eukprot:COSAG04_NODE_7356_length_1141_cov_1.409789_1_plen_137_part_10
MRQLQQFTVCDQKRRPHVRSPREWLAPVRQGLLFASVRARDRSRALSSALADTGPLTDTPPLLVPRLWPRLDCRLLPSFGLLARLFGGGGALVRISVGVLAGAVSQSKSSRCVGPSNEMQRPADVRTAPYIHVATRA